MFDVCILSAGPSYSIDTACSSTMYAFSNALQSIRNGDCDAAIVGGVTIDILPEVAETFTRLGMTSPDGKCKHLDNDGKALYVRKQIYGRAHYVKTSPRDVF